MVKADARELSPAAVLGWPRKHGSADDLAGAAFLIGPDIVLTCAHVVRDHLGLPNPAPAEAPAQPVTIRSEAIQGESLAKSLQAVGSATHAAVRENSGMWQSSGLPSRSRSASGQPSPDGCGQSVARS